MMTLWNDLDDMFTIMNAVMNGHMSDNRVDKTSLQNTGLKSVIKRPHNLLTIKDKNGQITSHRLEVVTTPFKKEDVKLSVLNNVLRVVCGSENHVDEDAEFMVYHGISSQSYEFSLKLSDKIDQEKITAAVEDGILKIELPMKEIEARGETPLQIEVK